MSGSTRDAREREEGSAELAPSIGAYLSAQRRLRGISVEELSRQTRIPLRSLERLESGTFDADVDGFVRGFVRTVAIALGLDPEEALSRTLREPEGGASGRPGPTLSVRRVAVALAVVAVVALVGILSSWLASSISGGADRERSGTKIVVRHDPVRALAESQGLSALTPAPALALAATQNQSPELAPGSAAPSAPADAPVRPAKREEPAEEGGAAAPLRPQASPVLPVPQASPAAPAQQAAPAAAVPPVSPAAPAP